MYDNPQILKRGLPQLFHFCYNSYRLIDSINRKLLNKELTSVSDCEEPEQLIEQMLRDKCHKETVGHASASSRAI